MAIRIHVTAVRGCSVEQVKTCFTEILGPAFEQVPLTEAHGWVWFRTSVWGVGNDALCKGLSKLGTPGLNFTTSDGSRWHLVVFGPGREPAQFLHEFGTLGYLPDPSRDSEYTEAEEEDFDPVDPKLQFLEEDPEPEKRKRPWSAFDSVAADFESMGLSLPDAIRDEMQGLPYSQALNRFRQWYADQLLAALTAAGIPFIAEAVRKALLWENVTENERGSDLGNLPRFCAALGLGGDWDEYVQQAENPPSPEEQECAVEPLPETAYLKTVLACVSVLALTPLQGDPVPLHLKKLDTVGFLAEACAGEEFPCTMVRLEMAEGFDVFRCPPPDEPGMRAEMEYQPRSVQFGLENQQLLTWRHFQERLGKPLAKMVRQPQSGTVMEVAFGHAQEPGTYQRYRGPLQDDTWHIAETYPPLTQEVLKDALALAASAERKKHTARDEAEADAVMSAVPKDSYLHNMDVRRKDLVISCKYDAGCLAKLFFRHRFRSFWNVAHAEQHFKKQYLERIQQEKQMRKSLVEAARRRAAPHEEAVFYEGKKSRFWRADFTQLTELDQTQRIQFDQAMTQLGYQHLGDFVAKKFRDVLLRCYGSPDGLVYALLMGKRAFYMGYECISRFADGSRLTTTTNGSVDSHPEIKVYYKLCAGMEPLQLEAKHRWGIERFRTRQKTEPVPLEMSLLGVMRSLDEAIAMEEQRQEREKQQQREEEAEDEE